jgi:transposase
MHLKTILNHVEKHKHFVYEDISFHEESIEGTRIEAHVRPRKGSKPICSGCGEQCAAYDHTGERRFMYVPLWGIPVFLVYVMRRVNCPDCGVKVERVPWSTGKSPITRSLALYLADWAKALSWQEVARRFGVNWRQVFESVRFVVEWGLLHRDLSGVSAIGIDEIQFGKGHHYLTVVYQLCGDIRRLLYVGPKREAASLSQFFEEMGEQWCANITHVCTDMWRAYLKVIEERLLNAVHILDRFHIVKLLNGAVDQVRKQEAAQLRRQGVDLLKGMKYVFLKRPENLTENQHRQLAALLNKRWLASVRAWLWKEKFQLFWEYESPYHARRYLRRWCKGAMRSRLSPLKKYVKTIRKHEPLIMNWFIAKKVYSSGAVEGMNRKINLVTRKSYGFRNYEVLKIALFHTLGHLPEPESTHRFC